MSFASASLGAAVETTLAKQWGADKANPNAKPKLTRPNGALWLRKYKILVTDKNDEEALNVSDLHCTFEVHKKRDRGGFYAIVRIYNLNSDTEDKLVMEGDRRPADHRGGVSSGADGNFQG